METATFKISPVQDKGYKGHYWIEYNQGSYKIKRMYSFKTSLGITVANDHSTGMQQSLYASIDGTGSLAGMRKNYGWKDQKVIKAHGSYYNLDRKSIQKPIDALIYVIETQGTQILTEQEVTLEFNLSHARKIS
jgi:hypothetical protein